MNFQLRLQLSSTKTRTPFASPRKRHLLSRARRGRSRASRRINLAFVLRSALDEALLEEKRQLVATRGRAGSSADAERERLEASLRQRYEDRLSELEEQASASMGIKKQLQAELAQSQVGLRASFPSSPSAGSDCSD